MNIKIASMTAGLALFGFVAVANAGEAIPLNSSQMDGVTAGWGSYQPPTFQFTKKIYIDEYVNKYIDKDVSSNTWVTGKLADSEAVATCAATNCLSETLTNTYVDPYVTQAYSGSTSAGN